ncbi:MAG TPA: response regulator transcription factor [Solirubrobacteraceae bacterium]|jgi:two-component system, OmpR family, response regulator ResD|nr:response regulator transcription factor [Solirubrobacteraceae bacterium]
MIEQTEGCRRPRASVLVVDDEPTIAEVVARYLQRAGYETRCAHDGPHALSVARAWRPDLLVLDVMLPGLDGLEVMRLLHEAELAPAGAGRRRRPAVILLTARAEESDRIVGLRRGADDYVVKPFSPAEVVARADAVLRRLIAHEQPVRAQAIEIDGLRIDAAARAVEVRGRPVALTALEFELLLHLASNPGQVFSRDQLMEAVWEAPRLNDTVTVHVRRLRAKVEPDPAHPRYIETARGVGYRFRAPAR